MTPIGTRVILHPNESRSRGLIHIPDISREGSTSCLVLEAGEKVSPQIKKGSIVLCETGFGERKNYTIENGPAFWAKEENIYAVIIKQKIYPIGRKVLIKRDIADSHVGSIVIPENRRYQSLHGTIVRLGITRKPFKTIGLKEGLRIQLEQWQPHFANVELEDGSYGVIVNESDLLCFEV